MLDDRRDVHVPSRLLIDHTLLQIVVPLHCIEQSSISSVTAGIYDKL
jgi:hypothetical protein